MHLHPELVKMEKIKHEMLSNRKGQNKAGIWGRDPRMDSSRKLGEKIVLRIADNIGKKAQELLKKLRE